MTRRNALKYIAISSISTVIPGLQAKKGKGGKKKKDDDKGKDKQQEKKLSGKLVVEKRGITKNYKLLADKPYSISKNLEKKVKEYEGMDVTVFGTITDAKIIKIAGITTK
jgi:hypothetical protein